MNRMKMRYFKDKQKFEPQFKQITDDGIINVCHRKFRIQQESLKEFRKNLNHVASAFFSLINTIDSLHSSFRNLYETTWIGHAPFIQSCQQTLDALRIFMEEFKVNILKSVEDYSEGFPRMQKMLDKRAKRASEYQKAKAQFDSKNRKQDSTKLKKFSEELKSAQTDYEAENEKLKAEFPKFLDNRLDTYIEWWNSMAVTEEKLANSIIQCAATRKGILSKLKEYNASGRYQILNQMSPLSMNNSLNQSKLLAQSTGNLVVSGNSNQASDMTFSAWDLTKPINDCVEPLQNDLRDMSLNRTASYQVPVKNKIDKFSDLDNLYKSADKKDSLKKRISFNQDYTRPLSNHGSELSRPPPPIDRESGSDIDDNNDEVDNPYSEIAFKTPRIRMQSRPNPDIPRVISNFKTSPRGYSSDTYDAIQSDKFYYQVIAKYSYAKQDDDELTLTKDDVVLVLPWEAQDQQEDGWLFGQNVETKQKGLFPENHTAKL